MKNRSIILTAIPSLLVYAGLSYTGLAAAPVDVVNTPNVNVANTTTNPVPITGTVTDAENPARNAVQQEVLFNFTSGGSTGQQSSISIPAGNIFVLEFASFFASTPNLVGITITVFGHAISGGGLTPIAYQLVIPPPNATTATISGSQAIRLYAQPSGFPLIVNTSVFPAADALVRVELSGYLVDAQ
jgi:hypothetical protein